MKAFVKWAWLTFFIVLFIGPWVFALYAGYALAFLVVYKFKPEWLEKL